MFKLSKSEHLNLVKIYEKGSDLIKEMPFIKRRRRKRKIIKIIKYCSYSVLVLFLLLIIFFSTQYYNFKSIYNQAKLGENNLYTAIALAQEQDFSQALIFTSKANNNFNFALDKLRDVKSSFFVSYFTFLKEQFNNGEYLLVTGEILSQAVGQGFSFGQELENLLESKKKLDFAKLSPKERKKILGHIYQSAPDLTGMKANIDLAYLNLEQIKYRGLFWLIKNKIEELKEKIQVSESLVAAVIPLSEILPAVAGYPEKATYLILLQDNNKLRPTGGFISTYGILELEYGEIINFITHDIYYLDIPVKDKLNIKPPEPLKRYLGINQWFMRDANWSPDFPTTAKNIEWFYQNEIKLIPSSQLEEVGALGVEFDGIIAITAKFITDFLTITGPIEVKNEIYTKDNFIDLLQYKVKEGEIQLGEPAWQKKEVIGEIAKKIKIKLIDSPFSQWSEILRTFNNNVINKDILIYLKDTSLQNLAIKQDLAGEIKDFVGDYLMIVDANLSTSAIDTIINRGIDYEIQQGHNGLFAKLQINYAYNKDFNNQADEYKTYTRVYTPLGSQLVKAEGMTAERIDVKNELGKTSFGVFISIKPKEIGSLYFEYKLPIDIYHSVSNGQYELYVQKQPGSKVKMLTIDLEFINSIKSYNPTGFYVDKISDSHIKWESDLNTDRKFEVIF